MTKKQQNGYSSSVAAKPSVHYSYFLKTSARYVEQIEKLHTKHAQSRRMYSIQQEGASLAAFVMQSEKIAKRLAKTVSAGDYEFTPAEQRTITVNDKERDLFALTITDHIIHGVVSESILEIMKPLFSSRLYSYLPGKTWWHALSDFARHVREHCKEKKDPRERGLYVLRRDVRKYTDTIPTDAYSPLWPLLRQILGIPQGQISGKESIAWNIVESVIRPVIHDPKEGVQFCKTMGVPTGSPISTTLFNVYLHPMDMLMEKLEGGFYARYADDVLFAHPDAEVAQEAEAVMSSFLKGYRVQFNEAKGENLYFNGAGRASDAWPESTAATKVPFLGCYVWFDGTISLQPHKVNDLIKEAERQARKTKALLRNSCRDDLGRAICKTVNQLIDPEAPHPHKTARLLRAAITNRPQLKDIDYRLAKLVANMMTGQSSAKAFRSVPYRTIRQNWGLQSLYHRRNRWGKKPRSGHPSKRY